ncbi:MAG: VWA domain-containing protein, partial [Methanobacteriota archaeon]
NPGNNVSVKDMGVFSPFFEDDMEAGGHASLGLWTPETTAQNAWELGSPTVIGPSQCHSLTDCWGTNLASQYERGADIRLETPAINLSNAEEVRLRFWHFYDTYGPFRNDGGFVEISDDGGLSWTHIEPYGDYPGSLDLTAPDPPGGGAGAYAGSSLVWERADFNLNPFLGKQIIIGFHLWTDSTNHQNGWAGWYIDDVQLIQIPIGSILIFTEIQDSGPGGERVEVYNTGEESDNLNNYVLVRETDNTTVGGTWNIPQINPGQYSQFTTTGTELDDDGELLSLVNTTSDWVEDQFGYGQKGVVPDPIWGESAARYWNGTAYDEYWSRSPVTSFGFNNIVPPWDNQTEVVLNEVLFNPQLVGDEFVEIYYIGNSSVNLRDFIVVCDNAYRINTDVILNSFASHYILLPTDYPGLFMEMDVGGENLYLYNSTGSYLDMVGWSSEHDIGTSMARIPEGFGTHDGYHDQSSYNAGWRFGKEPTMALLNLWPDQIGYGDLGDSISYNLTLLNQPSSDVVSFTFNSSSSWQIDFLEKDWTPITDTNSDGLLDTGVLPASSFYNFTINVTIPTQPPVGTEMTTEIYANSTINKGKDLAVVVARTYPHLEPMKRADPEEVYLEGVGVNEVSTIELEVFGGGYLITERHPQDTVFVIDSSQSMDTNDPLNLRLEAAKLYVDNMSVPDRAAVVEFNDVANLVPAPIGDHLSSNYTKIKQNIDTIGAQGGTNISAGLNAANTELINYGNSSHLWVEILLTDGMEASSNYPITSQRIQEAADNGIIIFTIGLGIGVNQTLLQEIADRTGGKYYFALDAEALEEIYTRIGLLIYDVAGKDTNVTDANPMIRDVVPPYIHVDYGSFSVFPDITYNNTDGTVFEWNVSEVMVNESWKVSYDVTCSQLGWVPVGVYPKARVSYINWNEQGTSMPFPNTTIHVILPPPSHPKNLRTSVVNDVDIRLDWDPPDASNVSHYLIYRSLHQRQFNFTIIEYDTSNDSVPARTNWTDTGAADPSKPREYYYIVRVVDSSGSVSTTSNTAGKWTKSFRSGRDTFSLPLEPFSSTNVSQFANDIQNTEFIRWLDGNGQWVTHTRGMGPGVNDNTTFLGESYEISLTAATNYTFVGLPGSMISYTEGFGETLQFREGLTADVLGSDISLEWQPLPGVASYKIYRSTKRDGLFEATLQPIKTLPASFTNHTDVGVALPGKEFYYWVIPIDPAGVNGSGTYSIGVWIEEYQMGSGAFALPLKLPVQVWIDEFCDMSPDILGIVHMMNGFWRLHAREMPKLVYDAVAEQAVGYQILTGGSVQLIFIGF